jgi:hypothetical protein
VKVDSCKIARLAYEGNEACWLPTFHAKVETDQGITLFLSRNFRDLLVILMYPKRFSRGRL